MSARGKDRRRQATLGCGLAAASLALASSVAALAQDRPNDQDGALGKITLGQRLVWKDDGDGISGLTVLNGSIQTQTRTQGLSLSFGGSIEEAVGDTGGIDFVTPSAALSYFRDGPDSRLTADFTYRVFDLEDALIEDEDGEILILDNGRRTNSAAAVGLQFGIESKFGGEVNLRYAKRDYQDVTSTKLYDSETRSADLGLHFQITPLTRAFVVSAISDTDGQGPNATDSRVELFGGGVQFQIDKVTTAELRLTQESVRRETPTSTLEADGLAYAIGLTRERPAGKWSMTFNSRPGTDGRRDTLTFGHDMQMPRYTLSLSAGLTRLDGGDPDPIFTLGYKLDLPRDADLGVTLTRRSISDDDGDQAINTSLSANYSQPLTENAGLSIGIGYRKSEVTSGTATDTERMVLDLGYHHDLTADWGIAAGYSYVQSTSDTRDDRDHKLYLGLETSYLWRP